MSQSLNAAVQSAFGNVAANYATSTVHAHGEDLHHMLKAVSLTGRERVLDAGCGAGHTALTFAPHVREVVAYDMTPTMLAQVKQLAAERGCNNIVTKLGDVGQLPFAVGEFDLVVTRYSAHHWLNLPQALGEIRRVLVPGGTVLISDIVAPESSLLDTWLQTIEVLRDPSHVRDHSIRQWQAMLEIAGFSTNVLFEWMLPLEFDAWVKRINTAELHVRALQSLFDAAPLEVREAFQVREHFDFTIPGALLMGQRQ
ncbi:MAG: class I SAM-dependent methyltransferase [Chloroflexota bacterium]|nr:class I SAM-dependent methyltransferase [Chloroflexota bacterium]